MAVGSQSQPRYSSPVGLRRSLTLWNLIIIGIVIIQPIAPMGIYGAINNEARGHVVTTILIAMVAMLFTAISYGKMARAYPSAGSAYTYVGREIHPALGYVTGWAMVMDYILNPLICTVICSELARNILSGSALLGVRHFLRWAFHGAESARNSDLGANQRNACRRNGHRGGHFLRVRDSLALGPARIRRQAFSRSPFTTRRHSTFTGCFAAPLSPCSHTLVSTASRLFPRKLKIRAAIFCSRPCWSA